MNPQLSLAVLGQCYTTYSKHTALWSAFAIEWLPFDDPAVITFLKADESRARGCAVIRLARVLFLRMGPRMLHVPLAPRSGFGFPLAAWCSVTGRFAMMRAAKAPAAYRPRELGRETDGYTCPYIQACSGTLAA